MSAQPINKQAKTLRVTFIWASGLTFALALLVLWVGGLGLAIYFLPRAYQADAVVSYVIVWILVLGALGGVVVKFVNGFYDWWRQQRLNSLLTHIERSKTRPTPLQRLNELLKDYEPWASANLSDSLKRQMAASPEFETTLTEATKLILEAITFQESYHTQEERDVFQTSWRAKAEMFAEHIAQNDPLAVQVVLNAIEKESGKGPDS